MLFRSQIWTQIRSGGFHNKDEPEKCLKKEVRLFLAGQLIGWNSVWKIWYSCNSDVKLVASADSSQESLIVPNRLCVHQLMPTH